MTDTQETVETTESDALTADEQAFFESGGEKEVAAETETTETVEKSAETEEETKQQQERDEKGKFVPHGALHAEREEHKKTRSELQELKEFRAQMEERMRWFDAASQQQQKKPEDEDPEPNREEDIFAHNAWLARKVQKLEQSAAQEANERAQANEATQQEQQIWSYWEQDSTSYAQSNPDFKNAASWLADHRDKQLQAISIFQPEFATKSARDKQIDAELKQIVITAAQSKRSAAEICYELAKGYGYTPEQAAAAAEAATGQDNGLTEKLKRLESAQNASKTVGQASGSAGGDEVTAESIANMSEDEFNRWVSVPENATRFNKLMGG